MLYEVITVFYSSQALRQLLMIRLYISRYMVTNYAEDITTLRNEFSGLTENMKRFDKSTDHPDRLKLLNSVRENLDAYMAGIEEVFQAVEKRNMLIADIRDNIGPWIIERANAIKISVQKEQGSLGPRLVQANRNGIILISILGIIAVILGMLAAGLVSGDIRKGIMNAVAVTRAVSEGDLTSNIHITGKDEISELLGNMKNMVDVV